jgi:hypothetical protein
VEVALSVPDYIEMQMQPVQQNVAIDQATAAAGADASQGGEVRGERCVCGWRTGVRLRNRRHGRAPLRIRVLVQVDVCDVCILPRM